MTEKPPDAKSPPDMPRWVKAIVLIVVLVILLVVVLVIGGGDHGPGNHASGMVTGIALLGGCHTLEIATASDDSTPCEFVPSEDRDE